MKKIERMISIRKDVDIGELFVFGDRHREEYETYLDLDMARTARRKFDQQKNWWTKVGVHDEYRFTKYSRSVIRRDEESGLWYVMLPLEDDILVSDLYPKKKINEIQSFLDERKWSKQALNLLKRNGNEVTSKYYGILPTKKGYEIRDFENNSHGLFSDLEEAVTYRDELLQQGVVI